MKKKKNPANDNLRNVMKTAWEKRLWHENAKRNVNCCTVSDNNDSNKRLKTLQWPKSQIRIPKCLKLRDSLRLKAKVYAYHLMGPGSKPVCIVWKKIYSPKLINLSHASKSENTMYNNALQKKKCFCKTNRGMFMKF